MAAENVFEKIHVDERDKADLGGLLEQLNLPPTAVQWVRKRQKAIYIITSVIVASVIIWALYGSYMDNRIAKSNSALVMAKNITGNEKADALQSVIDKFSGTESALWARIELARYNYEQKKYDFALKEFTLVRESLSKSNPLFPLVVYGIAQSEEAAKNFDSAAENYSLLKTINGYEGIGYSSIARIHEAEGKIEEAIQDLEQYLGIFGSDTKSSQEKAYISEKIARLKAAL